MKAAYDVSTVIAAAAKALPVWEAKYAAAKAAQERQLEALNARLKERVATIALIDGSTYRDSMGELYDDLIRMELRRPPNVPQLRICQRLANTNPQSIQYVVLDADEIEAIKPGLEETVTCRV